MSYLYTAGFVPTCRGAAAAAVQLLVIAIIIIVIIVTTHSLSLKILCAKLRTISFSSLSSSSGPPKISSWQHWHRPEMPCSLRLSSSRNSRLNSPHFTHCPPLRAISRLRPNNDIALSSLNCSNSFIILYTQQDSCQLTYPSLLAGSNPRSHPYHCHHRASTHPSHHKVEFLRAVPESCPAGGRSYLALRLGDSCSLDSYLYTAGFMPTCGRVAAATLQLLPNLYRIDRCSRVVRVLL